MREIAALLHWRTFSLGGNSQKPRLAEALLNTAPNQNEPMKLCRPNFKLLAILLVGCFGLARVGNAAFEVEAWGQYGGVSAALTNVVAIAQADHTKLALKNDGTIIAESGVFPATPPAGLTNVLSISGSMWGYEGYDRLNALRGDGTVVGWGFDIYPWAFPNPPAGLSNVVAISAGTFHTLALKSDGSVVGWGYNYYDQTNVPVGLSNVVAVAAGFVHSLALTSAGKVFGWGDNYFGETNVPSGLSNVVAIAVGQYHSLALKINGVVVAWGDDRFGQTSIPLGLSNVMAIAAGGRHNLALKRDGTIVAWGDNAGGPTTIPPGLSNVIAISAGGSSSLALLGDAPPVMQALATDATVNTNGFNVTIPTQSGRVYRLEYVSALGDTNWTALPLVAGNGGSRTLTDGSATNGGSRFYRVRRW